MNDQAAHIAWKTNAWKDAGMVSGYAQRMAERSGWNVLKNHVETRIFERFACGSDVLDIGIGTGRASLPLARRGYNVTGIDSSQAMLDKCRELAGPVPITLLPGDVARLPLPNDSFDTVMALNTFAHFPHWREILKEWVRVVRPGGRVIFDVYSLDHDIAYARAVGKPAEYGVSHFAPKDVGSFFLRLPIDELVSFADELGFTISAVVPYGVFFGRAGFNHFLTGGAVSGFSWDRLLSWVSVDPKLFELFVFLEEEIVARTTSETASRYMAVFDRRADSQANSRWLERNAEYAGELRGGLTADLLAARGGADAPKMRERLSNLLAHEPCMYALARIALANLAWRWPIRYHDFLEESQCRVLERVLQAGRHDAQMLELLSELGKVDALGARWTHEGVPLVTLLSYDAASEILDRAFDAFSPASGISARG